MEKRYRVLTCKDSFDHKPQGNEIRLITDNLVNNVAEWTPGELSWLLTNGHAFCPGVIKGNKLLVANWKEQQVFALDFDGDITINEFISMAEKINVLPAFIYTTFNHSDNHHKFRPVFIFKHKIIEQKVRKLIVETLHRLFDRKSDCGCRNANRIFFAGNKIVYENFEL